MNKIFLKRSLLFCLGVVFMYALACFRLQNEFDRDFHRFKLKADKPISYTIDIGKEGNLKYFLNSNIYSSYVRLDEAPKGNIRCEVEGMEMFLSQGSKKGIWAPLNDSGELKRRRKEVPLNIEIRVPRESLDSYNVAEGVVKFYNDDQYITDLTIKVINSRVKVN